MRIHNRKLFWRVPGPLTLLPSDGFPVYLVMLCVIGGWPSGTTVPRPLCIWLVSANGRGRQEISGWERWEAQTFLHFCVCFGLYLCQWLHFHGSSSCLAVHPLWSQLAPGSGKVVASCIANLWVAYSFPFALSALPTPVASCKIPVLNSPMWIVFLIGHWERHTLLKFFLREKIKHMA